MPGEVVGTAWVEVRPDVSGFEQETRRTVGGVLAGLATGFASAKVVGFFGDSLKAASSFNETASKAEQIFEGNSNAIRKWADGAVSDFGQTSQQALEAAASFGNMFKQLGIGGVEVTKMSKKMVELASDFASFHDADISEVLIAQQAAFRGEYDALQRFVPTINAAAVEQKALAMTSKESTKELTLGEKAAATYALMMEGAGKAAGDFDRTSGSAANQQRQFKAAISELQVTIGAALLPALIKVLEVLRPMVTFLSENKAIATALAVVIGGTLVAAFAAWTVNAVRGTIETLKLGSAMRGVGSAASTAAPMLATFGGIFAAGALISRYTENAYDLSAAIDKLGKTSGTAQVRLFALSAANIALERSLSPARAQLAVFNELLRSSPGAAKALLDQLRAGGADVSLLEAALKRYNKEQLIANGYAKSGAGAFDDEADSIDGVTDSLTQLNDYINASFDANLQLEQAQLRVDQSLQSLDETLQTTTADSLEGRSATLDAKQAIEAYGQQAKETASLVTSSSSEQASAQIDALSRVAADLAPGSPLRTWLDEYINALRNGIPTDIDTTLRLRFENVTGLSGSMLETFVNQSAFLGVGLPPEFAGGGIVPGPVGSPMFAIVHGGERIYDPLNPDPSMLVSGGDTIIINGNMPADPVTFAHVVSRTHRVHMQLAGR